MTRLIKQIPRALLISCIIFMVFLVIDLLNEERFNSFYSFWNYIGNYVTKHLLYCLFYSLSLYFVNAALYLKLDTYFGVDNYPPKRIFFGFIISFIVTLATIFLLQMIKEVFINNVSFLHFIANERPENYIGSSLITFVVVLGIHAFHFYKKLQENRVKEQKIIAGTASARFESLKNQIDPHFLFNSLNVLSSLIEENPDNAQRFTTSLSKVYRYVLEQKDKELVSIEEELSFAKTYMNLLKMRFENSLTYEIAIENIDPEAKVVPLSLQLLLENTVKHNVISEQKPLHIKITIEKEYLVIQNNFQKKEVLQERQGVGLQNIINRYGIITNRKVIVAQNEDAFIVKIPVLTKQITVMETSEKNIDNAYYRAKKRVEELKGFYGNLISYCCVIPFLIFINLRFSPGFQWFWFSALGWGFGLLMHALKVFGYSSNWEERKIQEILRKEEKKQTWE